MSDGKRQRPQQDRHHLRLMDTEVTVDMSVTDPGPMPESAEVAHDASSVIGTAVAHAAMSWVACCMEKPGISVSVATLGGGVFDAEVTLADGTYAFVRVTLALESGPRLRTLVEPIHP